MLKKILGKNYNKFGGHINLGGNKYVTTCDGVGTKALLANDYSTIAWDVVNHCANDILCEGALPVAFTNYIGMPKRNETQYHNLISNMKKACEFNNCEMVGGETAIMEDIYKDGALSVVGTMIGKKTFMTGTIQSDDCIVGFPSNGLHTNGYTVARNDLKNIIDNDYKGKNIRKMLLKPHSSYIKQILCMLSRRVNIKGMCHVTGGGWQNLYRTISVDHDFEIELSYIQPLIFELLKKYHDDRFMFNEFNMGIGMFVFIPSYQRAFLSTCLESGEYIVMGNVRPGNGEVRIEGKALLREIY